MGLVLGVTLRLVPRYDVTETIVACETLEDVLAGEREHPLQQFYLIPYRWSYLVQRRAVAPQLQSRRGPLAMLYRVWWFLGLDIGLHLIIGLVSKRPRWARAFFRHVLSRLIITNWTATDRAERMLVMEHDLFRHMEIELFVPAWHLRDAVQFVRDVVTWCDGSREPEGTYFTAIMERIGLSDELNALRGRFTHHYPITFRRVLPDDTLISMASSDSEEYYAISLITFAEPRDGFLAMAKFLTQSMAKLFTARPHWGKVCLLTPEEVESLYPHLHEFRAVCAKFDPHGAFRNEFVRNLEVRPAAVSPRASG